MVKNPMPKIKKSFDENSRTMSQGRKEKIQGKAVSPFCPEDCAMQRLPGKKWGWI